jgi:hypothetical protein
LRRAAAVGRKSSAHIAEWVESLTQIFDAIRDWALLRYHVRESSEHRNGATIPEKMEYPDPSHRSKGAAAEHLKRHE